MDEIQQKHQKVYSFLKRVLTQERYERVHAIEPCIIVANGFNKAFKFVILGDDRIYITENPPKVSKDIRIVIDLAIVTDIQMIHDVPEFLGGDLKNQTQHILITYKSSSSSPSSPRARKTPSPIPAASSTGLASSLMTASALLRLDYNDTLQPSTSGSYTARTMRDEVNSVRKLNSKSDKMSVSEGNIPQLLEKERLQNSRRLSDANTVKNNFLCVPGSRRPLPPPPKDSMPTFLTPQQHRKTRRKRQDSQDLNSSSSSNELDLSSFRDELSGDNDLSERQDFLSLEMKRTTYSHSAKSRSVDDAQSLVGKLNLKEDNVDGSSEGESEQLHLYILEQGSPMFVMVKSTWNNCILKSTLHYGEKTSTAGSKVDNSQLLTLFNQLKAEILNSHRIENTFVLINELLTAAQKSFALKRYFWKSPELFQFIVGQIQLYLPHSPSRTSKRRGNNRNDEFDFAVVLMECLVCMFRETEILMSRWNVLKENKGKAVKDLLECILATPTKSRRSEPKISPAAQLLLMGSTQDMTTAKKEEETNQLLSEITDCSTAILFELILAAHQALNFAVENTTLNICWLVEILDSSMSTEIFVERMMERKMAIISSSKKHISPKNAVLLYRQLYILHNIMDYSDFMATTIPRLYAEEFRYYIKASAIRKKLPSEYPLTTPVLSLLEKVTAKVLKNRPSVSFSR